jgi:hypothetical protein
LSRFSGSRAAPTCPDPVVARWRRILVSADLLTMSVMAGAGHVQADRGRIRLLTTPTIDTWLGLPTMLTLVLAAAGFWMAAPTSPGRGRASPTTTKR